MIFLLMTIIVFDKNISIIINKKNIFSLNHQYLVFQKIFLFYSCSSLRTLFETIFLHIFFFVNFFHLYSHLSLLLKMFEQIGGINKTEYFGTYRVDLVVTLFSRILDLHNFELVMHCLTPYEAGCVYMKIGWYVTLH